VRSRVPNRDATSVRTTHRNEPGAYRRRQGLVGTLWDEGSRRLPRRGRTLRRESDGGGTASSDKKSAVEKTYKPDSVPSRIWSQTGVIISLGFELPRTSSDLPEDLGRASRLPTFRRKPTDVFLFGLASGDAYPASDVATTAVGSYPTVSPLPEPQRQDLTSHRLGHRRFVLCGAGVGSLRLGVTQRPAHEVRTFLLERYHPKRSPGPLPRALEYRKQTREVASPCSPPLLPSERQNDPLGRS
jgi:hypothetical protein